MHRILALIALVVVLGLVNWSIYKKEDQLANGRIVYLHLAPVDPRSLMQGDYMALRFQIGTEVYNALPRAEDLPAWQGDIDTSDGHVVVKLDERQVATFGALYEGQELAGDEVMLCYRVRNGSVKFATDAFFFQEGHAEVYDKAQFGQFRVDDRGELLLVAMFDEELNELGPDMTSVDTPDTDASNMDSPSSDTGVSPGS